ncbi:papilin isoform X2 [Bicyclus anynana]|uniref:Papilin isoform X2 n=1 Tax=Bicyclus anynana TaxID=110368 RepID=A0ABM3LY57_BICAN|nr:papilin isoform X2 [Bicyclus anynana]
MGMLNLRSLLIAAIVICNCIPWITSRHHFKHNVNGHRSRHRRQGAGLYLPASYVIPGGEGEGPWSVWGEVSPCSRTCGGGVARQKRICLGSNNRSDGQPQCTGGDTKYFSCQTQDCPDGAGDYRSEQCAEYNDKLFKGNKYWWVPYTKSPNPCELNCMPHGERFYYRQQPKVVDGTRCNDESFDVCVDGVCQPVGCDMMLGSNAREDKCRQCRGNGTNCHTYKSIIDSIEFRLGYNDVLLIPQGATNIIISEVRASSNYLALRAKSDNVYYLNGEYHIDFPRSLMIAGTLWHYERSQQGLAAPDKLRCLGPTTEPLYLSILLQEENVGIEYEYSVPSSLAPPPNQTYNWVFDEWSECNATCGGGYQYRQVTCRSREDLNVVDENLCDVNFRPAYNQSCNTDACPPTWVTEPWGECSKPCGQGGSKSREVYCEKIITNGVTFRFKSKVGDKECFDVLGPKPEAVQDCNQNATCPTWFTGPWSHCDKLCDAGKQTRQVVCHQKIDGRVEVYQDSECAEEKPPTEQKCLLHPCEGVDWVFSEWSGCDSCLSTVRTRVAHCTTKNHEVVDPSLCAYHPTPVLQEPCDPSKLPPCQMLWYASQWGDCSVKCGKGVQTRDVFCGSFDGTYVTKIDDSKCDTATKFKTEKECEVPVDKCPYIWFASAWSECSKPCGGGDQNRTVMCLNGNKESLDCLGDGLLDLTQSCNEGPCDIDETMPMNSKSTPVTEDYDYEECEDEEEFPDESAEEFSYFPDDILDDYESTTAEGSGGSTDISLPSDTTDTVQPGTTEFLEYYDETSETGSSKSTDLFTTESTETTETDIVDTTVTSSDSSDASKITESESTTGTSTSDLTESSDISTMETTELSVTESSSTDSSESNATGTSESDLSTITTELGTSETTTENYGSSTAGTSETDTSLSGATDTTENTSITNESSTTESTDGITGTSVSTEISEAGTTETSVASSTETTETGLTDTTELTSIGSSESGPTESTTEGTTGTSESSSPESSVSSTTEISEASTTEITDSSTTQSGSTETASGSSSTEALSTTETSEGSTSETSEGSTIETSEGSTTEISEGSTTETSEGSTTETSEGSTIETSEGSTTETSEGSTTETSEGSTIETSEGSTIETSAGSTTETSEGTTDTTEPLESTSESSTSESSLTETPESSTLSTTELSSTDTTESSTTQSIDLSTTSTEPETTESTEQTLSTTESSLTESTITGSTDTSEAETSTSGSTEKTPWIWTSVKPKRPQCKPRKIAKCIKSKFGCCPDKRTRAKGPFDEGCPNPKTCKKSEFGCCPDGVSPAKGLHSAGCDTTPCNQTLYGCCKSDGKTAAEGNDEEGCPPPCKSSKYGCCKDQNTEAKGPEKQGCPETETTTTEKATPASTPEPAIAPTTTRIESCDTTEFGCCYDNETDASGPNGEGCPCSITEFGCCPDGITTANGVNLEGCIMSCNTSAYGCCPDNETPAHGPEYEGCCLQYEFGCCPDNYKPAEGPHLEGCGCHSAHFGCCPDNKTIAHGPNNEGCGCQYSQFGCCPDRRTEAQGPEYRGCACHTYQFGCCPDGVTTPTGPGYQGCICQHTKYGCCGDEVTAAKGPDGEGCDCSNSKFGCCPDGVTPSQGEKFLNCSDIPENKQAACALPQDKGSCGNFSVYWFYDISYGGCVRFWYGGCEGNGNRFLTQEECEDVCVHPPPKESCDLPKVKGICEGYNIRWYYDGSREQCSQFVYGGCLGNNNNFDSREICQERCEPEKTEDQCNLPIEQGSCAGNFARWGFNAERRRCEQFIWGGCEGNPNRFGSEAACLQRCNPPGAPILQEMCTLPAVTGECADYSRRWYYDTTHRRCREFYFGGCGGNENNFLSEFECENRCMEQVTTTPAPQPPPQPATEPTAAPATPIPAENDFCLEEIDSGPCTDLVDRWAYDSAQRTCIQFRYGGCAGNRNNFPTLEHCQAFCPPPQVDICHLPMVSGPCDASLMRWFYDAAADACSQFTYSGCEGNENRFDTLESCERQCRVGPVVTTTSTSTIAPEYIPPECRVTPTLEECSVAGEVWYLDVQQRACVAHTNPYSGLACRNTGVYPSQEACERSCGAFRDLDVCLYQVDSGPCLDSIPKVYFDYATGRCEQFSYGGCHGGPNRFSSVQECEQVCRPAVIDPCEQTPARGDCGNDVYMWYYDGRRDECGQFIYSGCNGNDNRFGTRDECEYRCKKSTTTVGISFLSTSTPTTTSTIRPSTTLSLFDPLENRFSEPECITPESVEPCGSNVTVYYYDTRTQACLVGDFGGCRHPNSYQTEEECERRCGAFKGVDVCAASLDPGPCLSTITKFYWDAISGRCLSFAYGGCHGGPNRFSTQEECENVCGATGPEPACLQPVSTGEPGCGVPSRRWYYHSVYGECLAFVYNGCGGTDNNFPSYDTCAVACRRQSPSVENEVTCDAYAAECASLRCEYGMQRTRAAGGCERCVCVPVDVDCEPLRQECAALKCNYGVDRSTGDDGCERCRCIEHPCLQTNCKDDERCVITPYKNAITYDDIRYSAECRIVNKTGTCPPRVDYYTTEAHCRTECNDDADCVGVGKCCERGCSKLCLEPASLVLSSPPPHTTFSPDLPHAPRPTDDREPEVRAQEGGKATLRCFLHGNPPPKITWRYGEITIEGDVGRYRLLSDGALEIVSLYRNDTGVYICVADNGLGVATQEIRLEVMDPVEGPAGISGTPNAVVVGELGHSLSVRCLAYGYPQPAIYWYRGQNGPMVPYSSSLYEARGNVLQIRKLMPETLGEYICQAYNGYGQPADWAFVVQANKPEEPEDYYVVSRQTERSVIEAQYQPSTAPTTARTTEIDIPYSVPVRTRIVADRTTLSAGSEISLPCDVDGFPVPEVYWTKDGVQIQRQQAGDRIYVTDARLTIYRANINDSGVYGCHANNGYTSDYSTVQISVEGLYIPPTCKDSPYFANCNLIVRSKFCHHKYYSTFCCKSCVEAGQLGPNELQMQADTAWRRK